jgi:hypothetical protein
MTQRNMILAGGTMALAILSFVIGDSAGQRSMRNPFRIQMDGVQAMLLVDRIVEERKLKCLLAHDRAAEALKAIDFKENSDLKVLADFLNGDLDPPAVAYITNQDPNIINELKTFKSKYGNTHPAVECSN